MPLAGALTATLNIQIVYPDGGSKGFNLTFTNALSPGGEVVDLQSGDNTLNYPTNSVGAIIIPPQGNSVLLTIRNAAAGNGPAIHKTNPTIIGRDSSQTALVINVGSTVSGCRVTFI